MKKKVIRVLESIVVIALVFLYAHIAKPHAIYDKTIDQVHMEQLRKVRMLY